MLDGSDLTDTSAGVHALQQDRGRRTWAPSGPSSAPSAGRSPATAWNTCCPERRFDLARFLAGTEGTLAVILNATVRLVADPPHKIMVALGYPSMADAADATPTLLDYRPTAVEGLSRPLVEIVRRQRGDAAVPPLPRGDGWVFVELVGDEPGEVGRASRGDAGRLRLSGRLRRRPPGPGAGAVEDPRGRSGSRRA